jgi:hypothetical protein
MLRKLSSVLKTKLCSGAGKVRPKVGRLATETLFYFLLERASLDQILPVFASERGLLFSRTSEAEHQIVDQVSRVAGDVAQDAVRVGQGDRGVGEAARSTVGTIDVGLVSEELDTLKHNFKIWNVE